MNTNKDLRNRYVLCLGELHDVFAYLRAIGSFVEGLGIADAWVQAGWYDSPSLVKQVLECGNMKRATRAHEATVNEISTYLLRVFLSQCREEIGDNLLVIQDAIREAMLSIDLKNNNGFQKSWQTLQNMVKLEMDD